MLGFRVSIDDILAGKRTDFPLTPISYPMERPIMNLLYESADQNMMQMIQRIMVIMHSKRETMQSIR
jgi:hypothetical protein